MPTITLRYSVLLALFVTGGCSSTAKIASGESVGYQPVAVESRWVPEGDSSYVDGSSFSWGLTSYREGDREQKFTISVEGKPEPRGWIEVVDEYQRASRKTLVRTAHKAELAFRPWTVASAGMDRFAVAGKDAAGRFVIESWTLADAPSVPLEDAPVEAADRGVAVARQFRRMRIYDGMLGDSISSLVLDSRARSVMVLTQEGEVRRFVRLENAPGAQPQVILDSLGCPELSHVGEGGDVFFQEGVGTCYELSPGLQGLMDGAASVLFIDRDDDGTFDGPPLIGTTAELEKMGIGAFMDRRPAYFRDQ